ncbi:unnamed protein product, partial [Symbiodinium microadriaticum]
VHSELTKLRDSAPIDGEAGRESGVSDIGGMTCAQEGMTIAQIKSLAALLWAQESSRCQAECGDRLQDRQRLHAEAMAAVVEEMKSNISAAACVPTSSRANGEAGRPDFALLGAGARVVSRLTSQTYTPPSSSPLVSSVMGTLGMETGVGGPEEALSRDTTVGHCWAMA